MAQSPVAAKAPGEALSLDGGAEEDAPFCLVGDLDRFLANPFFVIALPVPGKAPGADDGFAARPLTGSSATTETAVGFRSSSAPSSWLLFCCLSSFSDFMAALLTKTRKPPGDGRKAAAQDRSKCALVNEAIEWGSLRISLPVH